VVCDSVPEVLSADVPANAHELEALVGTQAL